MKNVLILNDTAAGDLHLGCQRVMKVLSDGLSSVGVNVIGSIPVGISWRDFADIGGLLSRADVIIINGEGTIHSGRKKAEDLLSIVEFAPSSTRLFLVNSIYEDNPQAWVHYLKRFHYISTRDSVSANEISKLLDRPIDFMPDFSMCGEVNFSRSVVAERVLIGDSVSWSTTKKLVDLSNEMRAAGAVVSLSPLSPIFKPEIQMRRFLPQVMADICSRWWLSELCGNNPQLVFFKSDIEYLECLSTSKLHITGRFHSTCFALLTQTPVLSISSNTSKIERLFLDSGVSSERVIDRNSLRGFGNNFVPIEYSSTEKENVARYISAGRSKFLSLMDRVANE